MLPENPEAAHGAAYPYVVAALGRDGAGELADHERGGQTPDERHDGEHDEGTCIAGFADDVFEAVGATGDHEVGGSKEREQAEFIA